MILPQHFCRGFRNADVDLLRIWAYGYDRRHGVEIRKPGFQTNLVSVAYQKCWTTNYVATHTSCASWLTVILGKPVYEYHTLSQKPYMPLEYCYVQESYKLWGLLISQVVLYKDVPLNKCNTKPVGFTMCRVTSEHTHFNSGTSPFSWLCPDFPVCLWQAVETPETKLLVLPILKSKYQWWQTNNLWQGRSSVPDDMLYCKKSFFLSYTHRWQVVGLCG